MIPRLKHAIALFLIGLILLGYAPLYVFAEETQNTQDNDISRTLEMSEHLDTDTSRLLPMGLAMTNLATPFKSKFTDITVESASTLNSSDSTTITNTYSQSVSYNEVLSANLKLVPLYAYTRSVKSLSGGITVNTLGNPNHVVPATFADLFSDVAAGSSKSSYNSFLGVGSYGGFLGTGLFADTSKVREAVNSDTTDALLDGEIPFLGIKDTDGKYIDAALVGTELWFAAHMCAYLNKAECDIFYANMQASPDPDIHLYMDIYGNITAVDGTILIPGYLNRLLLKPDTPTGSEDNLQLSSYGKLYLLSKQFLDSYLTTVSTADFQSDIKPERVKELIETALISKSQNRFSWIFNYPLSSKSLYNNLNITFADNSGIAHGNILSWAALGNYHNGNRNTVLFHASIPYKGSIASLDTDFPYIYTIKLPTGGTAKLFDETKSDAFGYLTISPDIIRTISQSSGIDTFYHLILYNYIDIYAADKLNLDLLKGLYASKEAIQPKDYSNFNALSEDQKRDNLFNKVNDILSNPGEFAAQTSNSFLAKIHRSLVDGFGKNILFTIEPFSEWKIIATIIQLIAYILAVLATFYGVLGMIAVFAKKKSWKWFIFLVVRLAVIIFVPYFTVSFSVDASNAICHKLLSNKAIYWSMNEYEVHLRNPETTGNPLAQYLSSLSGGPGSLVTQVYFPVPGGNPDSKKIEDHYMKMPLLSVFSTVMDSNSSQYDTSPFYNFYDTLRVQVLSSGRQTASGETDPRYTKFQFAEAVTKGDFLNAQAAADAIKDGTLTYDNGKPGDFLKLASMMSSSRSYSWYRNLKGSNYDRQGGGYQSMLFDQSSFVASPKAIDSSQGLTGLDLALAKVNQDTYDDIIRLATYSQVSDETLILHAAMAATMNFNRIIGSSSILNTNMPALPANVELTTVNWDLMLKSMYFSRYKSVIDPSTDLVTYVEKQGSIFSVLLVLISDLGVIAAGYMRYFAYILLLGVSVFAFTAAYFLREEFSNKAYIGLASACVLIIASHAAMSGLLAAVIRAESGIIGAPQNPIMALFDNTFALSVYVVIIIGAYVWATVKLLKFTVIHARDLGGEVYATLAKAAVGAMSATVNTITGSVGLGKFMSDSSSTEAANSNITATNATVGYKSTIAEPPEDMGISKAARFAKKRRSNQIAVEDDYGIENSVTEINNIVAGRASAIENTVIPFERRKRPVEPTTSTTEQPTQYSRPQVYQVSPDISRPQPQNPRQTRQHEQIQPLHRKPQGEHVSQPLYQQFEHQQQPEPAPFQHSEPVPPLQPPNMYESHVPIENVLLLDEENGGNILQPRKRPGLSS